MCMRDELGKDGEKVLCIGDLHVPSRAYDVPPPLKSSLASIRWDVVLCTGDLEERFVMDWLRELAGDAKLVVVSGNMDYLDLPSYGEVEVDEFLIGVIHGHQVYPRGDVRKLAGIALEKGVDILVNGHTHIPSINRLSLRGREVVLVNPGSLTGVWSGAGGSLVPSYSVIEIAGRKALISLYELREGRIELRTRETLIKDV